MEEVLGTYVCITHQKEIPCDESDGDYHLVSNWPPDVNKILNQTA